MTTITKERLLTIKQWRETYGPGSNVVLPAEEAEELARIALASLEAEPVAWTDEEELRDVRKYGFGEIFQCPPDKYADPRRVISLYRELPAPVVPDDWQLVPKKITLEMECALSKADSYEIGWLWALAAAPKYEVQNAKRVQNALNACRAAMLQSGNFRENKNSSTNNFREIAETSTNSPVTPDGWISCSDRMPEDTKMLLAFSQGQIVAAYWNWVMSPIDYKKYRAFTYLSGNILDDVTHWMPLPEPPQEVK
ncbi:DUF551 domain-containing protein [Escherichia coli]|uniref:DUF551 domain-containing protein n=1 Tax=Escherichia coli TaxID=562 RepID=UPI000D0F744A|nr:DUF551 domain-containing protein [Escherichia coli]